MNTSTLLRLHTSQPIRRFADALLTYAGQIYRVTIVAPWISLSDDKKSATNQILYALSQSKTPPPVLLITRSPKEIWHQRSIERLRSVTNAMTFIAQSLHTKIYFIECKKLRIVFFGSPNLTEKADQVNDEIAIEARSTVFDGSTIESSLINEFATYIQALRDRRDVVPYGG